MIQDTKCSCHYVWGLDRCYWDLWWQIGFGWAEAGTTLSRTPNAIDLPEDEWNEPRAQLRIQQREHEISTGIVESEADGQILLQKSSKNSVSIFIMISRALP